MNYIDKLKENMDLYELVDCIVWNRYDGDFIFTTFRNDGTVQIDIRNMYLGKCGGFIIDRDGTVIKGSGNIVKHVDIDLKKYLKNAVNCMSFEMTEDGLQSTAIA